MLSNTDAELEKKTYEALNNCWEILAQILVILDKLGFIEDWQNLRLTLMLYFSLGQFLDVFHLIHSHKQESWMLKPQ